MIIYNFISDDANGIYTIPVIGVLYVYLVSLDPLLLTNYESKSIDEMQESYLHHGVTSIPICIESNKVSSFSVVSDDIDVDSMSMVGNTGVELWYLYSRTSVINTDDGYMTDHDIVNDTSNNLHERFSFNIPIISNTDTNRFGVEISVELSIINGDSTIARRRRRMLRTEASTYRYITSWSKHMVDENYDSDSQEDIETDATQSDGSYTNIDVDFLNTDVLSPRQSSIGSRMSPNTAMKTVPIRIDNQLKSATIYLIVKKMIILMIGKIVILIQMYINYMILIEKLVCLTLHHDCDVHHDMDQVDKVLDYLDCQYIAKHEAPQIRIELHQVNKKWLHLVQYKKMIMKMKMILKILIILVIFDINSDSNDANDDDENKDNSVLAEQKQFFRKPILNKNKTEKRKKKNKNRKKNSKKKKKKKDNNKGVSLKDKNSNSNVDWIYI